MRSRPRGASTGFLYNILTKSVPRAAGTPQFRDKQIWHGSCHYECTPFVVPVVSIQNEAFKNSKRRRRHGRRRYFCRSDDDAISGDIAVYNAFVTSVANAITELAALGTIWTAIGSTSTVDARDNTGTNPFADGAGVPIYLLDGTTKIADNNTDFWDGSIDSIINVDETGSSHAGNSVFTGSVADGTAATYAYLGTPYLYSHAGLPNATNSGWLAASAPHISTSLTFFAISGILPAAAEAAPIPEPGVTAMFGVVLLGLGVARRRHLNARSS